MTDPWPIGGFPPGPPPPRPSGGPTTALILAAVVVGVAALAGMALLVLTLLGRGSDGHAEDARPFVLGGPTPPASVPDPLADIADGTVPGPGGEADRFCPSTQEIAALTDELAVEVERTPSLPHPLDVNGPQASGYGCEYGIGYHPAFASVVVLAGSDPVATMTEMVGTSGRWEVTEGDRDIPSIDLTLAHDGTHPQVMFAAGGDVYLVSVRRGGPGVVEELVELVQRRVE